MKVSNIKLSICVAATLGAFSLQAADLTWDSDPITTSGPQDGPGSWTSLASNTNWWNGAANVTWNNATPDNAIFGAGSGAAGFVTIPSSTTNTVGNITFVAPGSSNYTIAAGSSSTSKLNLSGTTITVAGGVLASNLVVLSGTSFTKLGAGTLVLKPGSSNINSGLTVVGAGTLVIGTTSGRLLIPGDLTITNGATAMLGASEQIADSAIITVDGGTFDSGGKSETIGGLILDNNGQILTASGSAAITNSSVYDVRSGVIFPNLAGAAGMTKTTSGTVILTNGSGANTFSGPTLISAGILALGHALGGNGLPASTVTITNTGVLRLDKDLQINSNATVDVASGTFDLSAHNEAISAVILDNNGSILNGGNNSKTLTVNTNLDFRNGLCASKLAGAGVMVKSTPATVVLTMDNQNSGGVLISGGILQLGDGSVNRGLFGTGPVTNNAAIVLNHSGAFTVSNTISGSGSLTNLGGTATLTGANTYSGGTTISAGTLLANNTSGSGTGSGAVTVPGGGLGGTGTINGAVNIQAGGNLAPGNSAIGTLTINNTLTLAGNTTIEISKGVGQDQVVANFVNYGGTLTVVNTGVALSAGDSFTNFVAGGRSGTFSTISGSPGSNLEYVFNPTNGVLSVVSTLSNPLLTASRSGNTLTFSWTDNGFKLQSQTNNPATLSTNWFDYPGGNVSGVMVSMDLTNASVFFRLAPQ